MDFDETQKTAIEKQVVDVIILSLENNTISESELPAIAQFVLDELGKVENNDQLLVFLSELSIKWPGFKNIEVVEKGKLSDQVEDKAVQDMLQLAKSGKIDEAISLAKTITQK